MPENMMHLNWLVLSYAQLLIATVALVQALVIFVYACTTMHHPLTRALVLGPIAVLSLTAICFSIIIPAAYFLQ